MPAWSNDSNETFYLGFILSKFCDLKTGMLGKLTYDNKELHFCQHDIIISNKIADPLLPQISVMDPGSKEMSRKVWKGFNATIVGSM